LVTGKTETFKGERRGGKRDVLSKGALRLTAKGWDPRGVPASKRVLTLSFQLRCAKNTNKCVKQNKKSAKCGWSTSHHKFAT